MKKRILSLAMAVALLLTMSGINAFAATSGILKSNSSFDNQVEVLLVERANALNKDPVELAELNKIDLRLHGLGVQFLSDAQVESQFPEAKSDRALAHSERTIEDIQRVPVPSSSTNTWMTYRSNVSYGGVNHDIQRLVAQPKSQNSRLADSGSRIIPYSYNWLAGSVNLLQSVGFSLAGEIPGSSLLLGFYDAVSSLASGISRTTEVSVPHITYSWSSTTTITFLYVRLASQTDDFQRLSMVSTRVDTEVGYQIPTFSYKNVSGNWVLTPQVIQGKRNTSAVPQGYDNTFDAVIEYNSWGFLLTRFVHRIQISGPENKNVESIYPFYAEFPAAVG